MSASGTLTYRCACQRTFIDPRDHHAQDHEIDDPASASKAASHVERFEIPEAWTNRPHHRV
jgi:hypothetical protein